MEKLPLDQYTISIDTTGEFIEKSIVLWADYLKETVRGLIYVVCYHYIPESIKNKYKDDDTIIWKDASGISIDELCAKMKCMEKEDALLIVGAGKIYEIEAPIEEKNSNCKIFAERMDRVFEQAQKLLSGCVAITQMDSASMNAIIEALKDSNNMSIVHVGDANANVALEIPEDITAEQAIMRIKQYATDMHMEENDLIARCGNLFEGKGFYAKAAVLYRSLQEPYFEMLARLNETLASGTNNYQTFLEQVIRPFEKDELIYYEAIFRTANYLSGGNHYFSAYSILSTANITISSRRCHEIADLKLRILGDITTASAALRKINPYKRETDASRLACERCFVLLESMPILALESSGYYKWREFIGCQSSDAWNSALLPAIKKTVARYKATNWKEQLECSLLKKYSLEGDDATCAHAILLLRDYSFVETLPPAEQISTGQMMKGTRVLAELNGAPEEKLWILYYIARNDIYFSENVQLPIISCLSIIEESIHSGDEGRKLGVGLFLLSWASLQYRIGNIIEGISCCLSALSLGMDPIPLLEDAFSIIARYIGDQAQEGRIDDIDDYIAFLRSIMPYNKTATTIVGLIGGESADEIGKLKEHVSRCEHDSEWMLDVTNLTQILIKTGSKEEKEEAAKLIVDNQKELIELADIRDDAAHQLLYAWEQVILHGKPTYENLKICMKLLELSIEKAKKRQTAFHQDERAGISVSFDKILREYLFICGMIYPAKDIPEDYRQKMKNGILNACAYCIPTSIIEQKDYNNCCDNTDEAQQEAMQLEKLKSLYYEKRTHKPPEDPEIVSLVQEINNLTEKAVCENPLYRPLEKNPGTNWQMVMQLLTEKDVLYQYVFTKNVVISILCTCSNVEVCSRIIDPDYMSPDTVMGAYGRAINTEKLSENKTEMVTELVAAPLMDYLKNHHINRLFLIPEMQMNTFSFAAAKRNDIYLVEKVDEIINLVDYRAIERYVHAENCKSHFFPVANCLYGNLNDGSISVLNRWLKQQAQEDFLVVHQENDSDEPLNDCQDVKAASTVALYGHGVTDPFARGMEGALRIAGISHMINLKSLIHKLRTRNLLVISCLSGSANEETPEKATGIWKSIFEQYAGNIILCKWSVPTKGTIKLMDRLFAYLKEGNISLGRALLLAQTNIKDEMSDPLQWAGVEFWIN